jgi:NAD(P)-dependent dehydrogenase (short-subunit alcohol dehydrogenase family)
VKKNKWFDLSKKKCVVVGSEGLLGRGILKALEDSGAQVIGLDTKSSKRKTTLKLDITKEKEVADFFRSIKNSSGEWAFINCSYPRTENWGSLNLENVSLDSFTKNTEIHLGSAFVFSRESAKFLRTHGGGSLINFGSIYGVVGPDLEIYRGTKLQNPSPYAAIKGGINGLTRYIATTYGKHQVRANVVCPGGIFDGQPHSFVKAYEKRTPLGRMAKVDDIAGVVAFLVSPAGQYINGQILMVDGGWTAW